MLVWIVQEETHVLRHMQGAVLDKLLVRKGEEVSVSSTR